MLEDNKSETINRRQNVYFHPVVMEKIDPNDDPNIFFFFFRLFFTITICCIGIFFPL